MVSVPVPVPERMEDRHSLYKHQEGGWPCDYSGQLQRLDLKLLTPRTDEGLNHWPYYSMRIDQHLEQRPQRVLISDFVLACIQDANRFGQGWVGNVKPKCTPAVGPKCKEITAASRMS